MADNLPLIPGKETVYTDVKPVLREVFRELDQLPPILDKTSATDDEKQWLEKYDSECAKIWHHEESLKDKFANRISRKAPLNLYRLHRPENQDPRPDEDLINRNDLMPSILQSATGDKSLWVQNVLNKSSCDFSYKEKSVDTRLHEPLNTDALDARSRQTYSIGKLRTVWKKPVQHVNIIQPLPEYIYCVPAEINFVNFTPGHAYSQLLRLENISKFEIRLSVSLPQRRELQVELASSHGLRVTAGSATELKIHFYPNVVRAFQDELRIRTSLGKGIVVPINCIMQPPELYMFVQRMGQTIFTCDDIMNFKVSENQDVIDLGAVLLGNDHYASLVLRCKEEHVSFFLLSEDAWIDCNIEELTAEGNVIIGPFTIHPAWWAGGGVIRGSVRCRAPTVGFHSVAIRILSSTDVTRLFQIVADAVYYDPSHICIKANEKDYDINSEDDPDCEYYINLGTAFPNRPLSSILQIINTSPIQYTFYWKLRPWGICSCGQEYMTRESFLEDYGDMADPAHDHGCSGVQHVKEMESQDNCLEQSIPLIELEPDAASLRERGACTVRVRMPDTSARVGTHRAVLQFVLENIPLEAFKPGYHANFVSKKTVTEASPDGNVVTRTLCDIVHAQVEVWWNVVPVQFVLDPPILPLIHSRRVKAVDVSFCATQLHGVDFISTNWESSAPMVLPEGLQLSPFHTVGAKMVVPLPLLPNEYPDQDVITLKTGTEEWSAKCYVTRSCATRHPALKPVRHWLGVVVPGAKVSAIMEVINDTHQDICWWATPYRWIGENPPSKACAQAARTCYTCHERACTCSLLRPHRGFIAHDQRSKIEYNVHAPMTDRIVATLVKVTRTAPDTGSIPVAEGTNSRATLLVYRVLAPRLVLEVFPCGGDKKGNCEACDLDSGEKSQGCALLRPSRALTPCRCSCYKLRITNTTPIATTVCWEAPVDGEEFLKVKFLPNDFEIGSYNEKVISVILEPRRVCGRRLFVLRAQVAHAYLPLYLIIDTAIDGVRITLDVPLGGAENHDSFVTLRRMQMETYPWDKSNQATTKEELFEAEDEKREIVQVQENICYCKYELKYIFPKKPIRSPDSVPSTEIVTSPPPPTRVCECCAKTKPVLPEFEEPCCLQFRDLPLKTVRTRRLTIRNDGKMTARWRMLVRRWPRQNNRAAVDAVTMAIAGGDRWASDVKSPGIAIQCSPAKGICAAGQNMDVLVQVYADCWGLYYDQIMLLVDSLEPIVVDVWIEAVGPVLQFASPSCGLQDYDSTMWLSSSDPDRTLRLKNISRSTLTVHAYMLLEHEHFQDTLPFRLYMRFTDNLKPYCPCCNRVSSDMLSISDEASLFSEKYSTGFELYLDDDYGLQDEKYYKIEPPECSVAPGEWKEWRVTLKPGFYSEIAPPGLVLLRTIPIDDRGDFWFRREMAPARVGLRQAPRMPILRLSCKEVRMQLCALELNYNEIARVRKRFRMRNIGTAPLLVRCTTESPWQIVMNKAHHDCECACVNELGERHEEVELMVEPWSSTAMCVEVLVDTSKLWPEVEEVQDVDKKCSLVYSYPSECVVAGQVTFSCDHGLLETLPLILQVDFPKLSLEPEHIDFGFVTHENTRKTYFSVWHSSRSATITLGVSWHGNAKLRLYPRHLRVGPGTRERIYIQYTAVWTGAPVPVEGCVRLAAAAGAGAWCRGALYVRAQPARDAKFKKQVHDYTDQWNLWPPSL